MRSDQKRVGHAEEKEKKEAKAIRPRGKLKQAENQFWPFCVSPRESKTQRKRELQLERCNPDEEKERNTVSVRK